MPSSSRRLLSHAFEAIDARYLLTPGGVGRTQLGNVKSARNLSQTPFCTPIHNRREVALHRTGQADAEWLRREL